MGFTPLILTHAISALAALIVGGLALRMKKGSARHRLAGRGWVLLMAVVAVSSFWIKTSGGWSVIHLLSVGTLVVLALAIRAAIRKDIQTHRRLMGQLYAGGLVVAGVFTLLPNRLLGEMLWHTLGLA